MKILLIFAVAVFAICAQTMADEGNSALRAVAQSTGGFANTFLKTVAEEQPGNLICSPLSAQVVLAMAAYGAGSTTATQMRSSLLIPSDNELGQSGYLSLIESLNSVQGVELRLANKVYTANNFVVKDAFKQLTATKFLSASEVVDFAQPKVAADTINAWCEAQTQHRIKDIIDPDSVDPLTKLVLVNAVYFKGQWDKKFDPALTLNRTFHVDTQTTKQVPTMHIKSSLKMGDLPELDARFIEIPYKGGQVSMIIILPNEIDGLKRVQDNLHLSNLTESLRRAYPREVELFLPRFKIESTMDLKRPLEKMGMTDMFTSSANFSGISDTPLEVSKVIQKAYIDVNEEGAEAAAVTVGGIVATSAFFPEPPLRIFTVDRPVYYEIRHREYDLPLFTGVVHLPVAP